MNRYVLWRIEHLNTGTAWTWLTSIEASNVVAAENKFRLAGWMEHIKGPAYYLITMK